MAELCGILNLSADSFSDGGRFVDAADALRHAEGLREGGADWIDVGAEASNPDAASIAPAVQIARLTPVVRALLRDGARVSVDTHEPSVIRAMIDLGAQMINDITGLADPRTLGVLASAPNVKIVIMHSRNNGPNAERRTYGERDLIADIRAFFTQRIAAAEAAGIPRTRLIADPGMGFFLDTAKEASVTVLREIPALRAIGLPLYVSTSRKSFVSALLGGGRAPLDRAAGTLATELFALEQGASYVRTHDPRALRDAWTVWTALRYSGNTKVNV